MATRYTFVVTYEASVMRSAVRNYLVRALIVEHSWMSVLAIMSVLGAGSLLLWGEGGFTTGVFAGLVVAILALFAAIGVAHWRGMKAKLDRMREPRATVSLADDGIELVASSGSVRLPWDTIRQIWKFDRVWLLMSAPNQFITLPLAGIAGDALQFLESKIQPRRL